MYSYLKKLPLLFCLFFLISLGICAPLNKVSADENFDLSLETSYKVRVDGVTEVVHTFTATNKSPELFLSKYGTKITSNNVSNVRILEGKNELSANVVTTENETSIGVEFPEPVVGQGKKRVFSIIYQTPDLAVVSGNALEVFVPRLANSNEYTTYTVQLATPVKFGPPIRVTPSYSSWTTKDNEVITYFNSIKNTGVSAQFGQEQIYQLELKYHLYNPTGNTGLAELALPPDTSFQKVQYQALEPRPTSLKVDSDGNWIASYEVSAQNQMTVTASLLAKVSSTANSNIPIVPPTPQYLKSAEFWPTNNQLVKAAAQTVTTPKEIYDYVVNTLSYNYQKIGDLNERLGADTVLRQPTNAVCLEYADLFITLARANSIPARRLTGYAYTENSTLRPLSLVDDILHAWPEYYNQELQNWIPIDPTWADTTGGLNYFDQLDLNHVVFAINGQSSSLPYAAGTYKLPDQNSKDISVSFAKSFPNVAQQIQVKLTPAKIAGLTIPGQYVLEIENSTGEAWYNLPVKLTSDSQKFDQVTYYGPEAVTSLLPFQKYQIPVSLRTSNWLRIEKLPLQLQVGNEIITTPIISGNNLTRYFQDPRVVLGLGISLVITSLSAGSVLVFRRKR